MQEGHEREDLDVIVDLLSLNVGVIVMVDERGIDEGIRQYQHHHRDLKR
jgi:hypothetical protein